MRTRLTVPLALVVLGLAAQAAHSEDSCDPVLQYAARNYTREDVYNQLASELYQHECSGSSYKSSESATLSLGIPLDSLPLSFGASGGSVSEKMQSFCRTYHTLENAQSSQTKVSNTVVQSSTQAWLECKRLAAKGVEFRPEINKTVVTVAVLHTNADALTVGPITYDHSLADCRYQGKGIFAGVKVADQSTSVTLPDSKQLAITCTRVPQHGPKGETLYPGFDLVIATDKDTLSLPVLPDANMPVTWATDIENEIAQIRAKQDAHDATLVAERADLDKVTKAAGACKQSRPYQRWETTDSTGKAPDDGTGWAVHFDHGDQFLCKQGWYLRGISFTHQSGHGGTHEEVTSIECCPVSG